MIIFIVLFILLIFYKSKFKRKGIFDDFLSKNRTDSIKGIFIVVVFISHISEYYSVSGTDLTAWYDYSFFLPAKALGQLSVVMFLFYSGYGIKESINLKGNKYINSIPNRRILNTLVNFDIAVFIYCIVLNKDYSIVTIISSLLGWDSVGNSNWYIFDIIILYFFTYIAYRINSKHSILIIGLLISLFIMLLSIYKGTWWYNTLYAYWAGICFSEYKNVLITKTKKNFLYTTLFIIAGALISLCIYLIFYDQFKNDKEFIGGIVFNMMSVSFAFIVVIFTMKVSIQNRCLIFIGKNLFPIYIYQRLPMITLSNMYPFLVTDYPPIYLLLCIIITVTISLLYKYFSLNIL